MATTPTRAAEKWVRNLSGATQEIRDGVNAVTQSPTDKAADQVDKYVLRVQEAAASGKYAARLRSVSLEDWKRATIDKGLQRIPQGAAAATGDVEAFMAELLPFQERLKSTIDAMPDTTLEDSIARQAAWTRGMAEFQRS
jgi:predicted transcriptional regulator